MVKSKVKEIRFSDHFGLGKAQPGLDFVDIPVNGDIQLFVDPYAFTLENDPWFVDSNNLIIDYFSLLIEAIRAGNLDQANRLLTNLHEPRETHLGFSALGSSGRGIGPDQATDLLDALKNSQAVQTGKLKDLADAGAVIAIVLEHLRQRHHVRHAGAEVIGEVVDARGTGPQPGEQGRTAGAAQGELAVSAIELHAHFRQPIDVRRLDERMAIAAEVIVHVVDRDEQHVELTAGGSGRRCPERGQGEAEKELNLLHDGSQGFEKGSVACRQNPLGLTQ